VLLKGGFDLGHSTLQLDHVQLLSLDEGSLVQLGEFDVGVLGGSDGFF
jgi:hypothetical protein